MNLKKILFTCLILMILSVTAVSATDSDNINATDSIEPAQAIKPVKTVDHDSNLEPVSKNKPVDLSQIQTTSTSPGTFDDLQLEINNAEEGSVLVLTRDYTGHYGSRIHLDRDITIDGQGHTLDCLGEGGCSAFYSTSGTIVLKNIRIINGHNDYNDQGGALHIEGSAKYTLENCIFENNWADDYGGAIYNDGQALTIINCTFIGNTADDESGGAIYSAKEVNIEKSIFTNNKADNNGGALSVGYENSYLKGCIFKCNTADENGGAVNLNSGILYLDNCTFEKNHAELRGGAVESVCIYINIKQPENEPLNTYFIENSVSRSGSNQGGAIYTSHGGRAVNTYFKENTAKLDGGAIYVGESGDIHIDHCLFEANSATHGYYNCHGGAIYAVHNVYIHNSTFKNNYAHDYGGAIYAKNVRINADRESETANTFFIKNRVTDDNGGAIYTENDVYARNAEFTGNSALVDGGAIYAKNNIEVVKSIFKSNQANGAPITRCYGGAIHTEKNAKINNCTFKNNNADNRGGAIHASTVTIEGDKNTFEGNSAKDYGGAIYTETFTNDVSHVSFINNIANAGDGGAIYINKENSITFIDCTFIDNRASNKGGAIYMDSKYSHINILVNVFINNCASEGQSVFNTGYYDSIYGNSWSTIPNENNDQLVEWKALSSNIHHTDSHPMII